MKKAAVTDTASTQIRQIDKKYARLFEDLSKSEQEKAIILDAMTELVLFLDTNLRVIWANKAMREAFNLKPGQLNGKNWDEIADVLSGEAEALLARQFERLLPQIGSHVETLLLPDEVFAGAVDTESPQGVAALVKFKEHTLDATLHGAEPLVVDDSENFILDHCSASWGNSMTLVARGINDLYTVQWCIASETCAFDAIDATYVRDVEPGELVIIDKNGLQSKTWSRGEKEAMCVFEYIYFARPDSIIDGKLVYSARMAMGAQLAEEYPVGADQNDRSRVDGYGSALCDRR